MLLFVGWTNYLVCWGENLGATDKAMIDSIIKTGVSCN